MIANAKKAVTQLQSMKVKEVEFVMDSRISNLKETAGNFVSAFDQANYQRILKRVEDGEKKDGEDVDPRTVGHTKNVKNYVVHLEDASI